MTVDVHLLRTADIRDGCRCTIVVLFEDHAVYLYGCDVCSLCTITNAADIVVMVVLCFILLAIVSPKRSITHNLLACFVRLVRLVRVVGSSWKQLDLRNLG